MPASKIDNSDATDRPEGNLVPEGGWGWMVAMGMSIMFVVTMGPLGSFGLIFGDYLEDLGEGTQSVTVIMSVYVSSMSFIGLVTNYALKSYSCRQVGIVGGLLCFSGNLLTAFAVSVFHMTVTYGILQGVGVGLMIPATFTSFNTYFSRRRSAVMGMSQMVIGIGIMIYPYIIHKLMEHYGFRGTQALLAALSLNAVFGMMTLQPVEWHFKVTIVSTNSVQTRSKRKLLELQEYKHLREGSAISENHNPHERSASNSALSDRMTHIQEVIIEGQVVDFAATEVPKTAEDATAEAEDLGADNPLLEGVGGRLMLQVPTDHVCAEPCVVTCAALFPRGYNKVPRHSVTSLSSSVVTALGVTDRRASSVRRISVPSKTLDRTWTDAVVDFFDLGLLKDPVYVNITLGVSFAFFSDNIFFTLHPLLLFTFGFSKSDVALCIVIGAAADIAGRLCLVLLGACVTVPSRLLFFGGLVCTAFLRTLFLQFNDYLTVAVLTACLGFFRSCIFVELPLVFAEHCAPERFPSAYGLFMVVSGIVGIVAGPFVGMIRDVTGSYSICMHTLTGIMLMCIVPWALEMAINRTACRIRQNEQKH